ncbi:MAG: hypothetical protein KAR16_06065 [Bacteroidales bacterium]|nr:hypothetical protein [Bacteroidales bacterium]
MKYLNYTLVLALSLALFASCGSNSKKDQSTGTFDIQDYITAAETIEPALNNVDQVLRILEMVNAEYYDVLCNDPYSAHAYKASYPIAAANLGIYVTDILYHFYGEATETMYLSFSAAQELAKHIGVESEFASWTIEKLEGSTLHRDTVTMLFNSLLADSENYETEKETVFVHTAFLTGSFVEKVHITGNLLKQKLLVEEKSQDDEGDIRELLVIYLNQLNPSTGVLYDAFVHQQDQLEGLVVITTFERLKALSEHLIELKPTLAVAPISEIASNEELKTSFQLIENLRNVLVTSSE